MTTTTGANRAIRLHLEPGTLEFGKPFTSGSHLSGLLALGAVYHAVDCCKGIPTDAEGLEMIHDELIEAQRGIASLIQNIGLLLAHADTKELPKGAVEDIGWGLAGLGEIGFDLACLSQFTKKEARHDHEA